MRTVWIGAIPEVATIGSLAVNLRARLLEFVRGSAMPSETDIFAHDVRRRIAWERLPEIATLIGLVAED